MTGGNGGATGSSPKLGPADATPVRTAGMLLILTAVLTAVAIGGRVAADADQPTLAESMVAIGERSVLYGTGGAGRFLSGVTLVLAAWLLWRALRIREPGGILLVSGLLALSGALTAVSGLCSVALALSASPTPEVTPAIEAISAVRWITGKAGFSAAGLALVAAARSQWVAGGTLRLFSPLSAVVGLGMQLIWVDAATAVHRLTGPAFFLWLLVIGAMLVTGRVERHFTAMLARSG